MSDYFYFYIKVNFLSKGWLMASLVPKSIQIRKAWYLIKNFGKLKKKKNEVQNKCLVIVMGYISFVHWVYNSINFRVFSWMKLTQSPVTLKDKENCKGACLQEASWEWKGVQVYLWLISKTFPRTMEMATNPKMTLVMNVIRIRIHNNLIHVASIVKFLIDI